MRLPGRSAYYTGALSTGVIAQNYAMNLGDIQGNARFTSLFKEYRILGIDIELICGNPTSGITTFHFTEVNDGTPGVNDALEREVVSMTNNACNSKAISSMSWRARDLTDLQFDDIASTSLTPVWFRTYTDNANFGSGVATADNAQWYVKPIFYVEFRGLSTL